MLEIIGKLLAVDWLLVSKGLAFMMTGTMFDCLFVLEKFLVVAFVVSAINAITTLVAVLPCRC